MGSQAPPPLVPRVLEGKLAIVTGSARSIGAAIARNLASKGCNLVINHSTSASSPLASALATELESAHQIQALPIQADISQKEDCERLVSTARSHFSRSFRRPHSPSPPPPDSSSSSSSPSFQIDIIIHNAAILYLGPLESVKPEEFHRIYAVNVLGPTLLTAAAKPFLPTDRSGRIIFMSSINPKVGTPETSLYSGTKAAVEALARVWCRELAERCTVNSINPGPVMTDMYLGAPEEVKKSLAKWNPVTPLSGVRKGVDTEEVVSLGERLGLGGRGAYDWEIAGLVGMLCSPESGWCTGSLVSANGGLSFSY